MLTLDFSDDLWEPPEAEFKPLLDFENKVLSEVPQSDARFQMVVTPYITCL